MGASCYRSCVLLVVTAIASCLLQNQNGAAAGAFTLSTPTPSPRHVGSNARTQRTFADLTVNQGMERFSENTIESTKRRHGVSDVLKLRAGTKEDDKTSNSKLMHELFAEMLGTFFIVALGTGSVMAAIFDNALVGLFQIAACWVIAVTVAISTTASVSGAHLNPAISVSLALLRPSKAFGWAKVLPYCLAQLVGGILGSWVNLVMYATKIRDFEKANGIVRGTTASIASAKAFGEYFAAPVTWPVALFAEAFGTAILAFVIFSLTNSKNDTTKNSVFIPPIIGATVGALICMIAPLTQAGFNPARDFGPRIVAWMAGWGKIAFQGWWLYIVGPIIGAPIGAYVADKLLLP